MYAASGPYPQPVRLLLDQGAEENRRDKEEGFTALMFAALRRLFGLRAEMIGDPVFTPDGRAIERWKLFKE